METNQVNEKTKTIGKIINLIDNDTTTGLGRIHKNIVKGILLRGHDREQKDKDIISKLEEHIKTQYYRILEFKEIEQYIFVKLESKSGPDENSEYWVTYDKTIDKVYNNFATSFDIAMIVALSNKLGSDSRLKDGFIQLTMKTLDIEDYEN